MASTDTASKEKINGATVHTNARQKISRSIVKLTNSDVSYQDEHTPAYVILFAYSMMPADRQIHVAFLNSLYITEIHATHAEVPHYILEALFTHDECVTLNLVDYPYTNLVPSCDMTNLSAVTLQRAAYLTDINLLADYPYNVNARGAQYWYFGGLSAVGAFALLTDEVKNRWGVVRDNHYFACIR